MRGIYVASIDARPDEQPTTPVLPADDGPLLVRDARWDHAQVVFLRQGELLAQPFDTTALKPIGDAIPIAAGVAAAGNGSGWFSASANGDVLLYLTGFSQRVAHAGLGRSNGCRRADQSAAVTLRLCTIVTGRHAGGARGS
jgi:hypothetical protein